MILFKYRTKKKKNIYNLVIPSILQIKTSDHFITKYMIIPSTLVHTHSYILQSNGQKPKQHLEG